VRAVAVEQLTSLGYCVVETENGDTASRCLKRRAAEFDWFFSDMMMQALVDGFELAQLLARALAEQESAADLRILRRRRRQTREQAMGVTLFGKALFARPILHVPFVRPLAA